jgi:hypothetical protein
MALRRILLTASAVKAGQPWPACGQPPVCLGFEPIGSGEELEAFAIIAEARRTSRMHRA